MLTSQEVFNGVRGVSCNRPASSVHSPKEPNLVHSFKHERYKT